MSCTDKSRLKRYATRPGPPFAANDCKGERKKGNDGLMYVSRADKNGVYRFYKTAAAKKKKASAKGRKTSAKGRKTSAKGRKTSAAKRRAAKTTAVGLFGSSSTTVVAKRKASAGKRKRKPSAKGKKKTSAKGKVKRARKASAKGKVKRARSAFIYFSSAQKFPKGTEFAARAAAVGEMWRNLSAKKRAKYNEMAKKDKLRSARERAALKK